MADRSIDPDCLPTGRVNDLVSLPNDLAEAAQPAWGPSVILGQAQILTECPCVSIRSRSTITKARSLRGPVLPRLRDHLRLFCSRNVKSPNRISPGTSP